MSDRSGNVNVNVKVKGFATSTVQVALYEVLVGRPPSVGESPVSVAYDHVRQPPMPPSQLVPEISRTVDTMVLRALAKEPSAHYESARAMNDDIGH